VINKLAPTGALTLPVGARPTSTITKRQALMAHRTDQTPAQPSPAERVAALHREAAADYATAHTQRSQAAARDQLALARAHAQEAAGNR